MLCISHTFVQVNFREQRNIRQAIKHIFPYANYMSLLNTIMTLSYHYNGIAWCQKRKRL